MTETKNVNSVLQKFQQIEHNFNRNYLLTLFQIRSIVDDEKDPKDLRQFELLQQSYEHWFRKLQDNPRDTSACNAFYEAVKDHHELILGRDTRVFSVDGDFFSKIFEQPGLDTPYLFNELRDGLDPDDEEDEKLSPEEKDGKDNLWNSIIALYRLCVLISVYLKNELIKEIIDMILLSNPDISQSNIFEKILGEFKGKRRLRKLIMKLLKSNEDSFSDIFSSLQKVISTFSSEVSLDLDLQKNMDRAQAQLQTTFCNMLDDIGVKNLGREAVELLLASLQENNQISQQALVESKVISAEQLLSIQEAYRLRGLSKLNISKTVKDLGSTMEQMCKAWESGDEDQVKRVLASAGTGLDLDPAEMEKLTADVAAFENEENEEDETDD